MDKPHTFAASVRPIRRPRRCSLRLTAVLPSSPRLAYERDHEGQEENETLHKQVHEKGHEEVDATQKCLCDLMPF